MNRTSFRYWHKDVEFMSDQKKNVIASLPARSELAIMIIETGHNLQVFHPHHTIA